VKAVMNLRVPHSAGNLSAYQEKLCSMGLVSNLPVLIKHLQSFRVV
jgi:hypothetical protein